MPRKRTDPAADVLAYFTDQPYEVAVVVLGLVKAQMLKRAPTTPVQVRRKRQPKATVVPPILTPYQQAEAAHDQIDQAIHAAAPPASGVVVKTRKRKMRADSPRPVSEATPLVPPVSTVGEDENSNID